MNNLLNGKNRLAASFIVGLLIGALLGSLFGSRIYNISSPRAAEACEQPKPSPSTPIVPPPANPPPQIISFTANPSSVDVSNGPVSVTLKWATKNGDQNRIEGIGNVPLNSDGYSFTVLQTRTLQMTLIDTVTGKTDSKAVVIWARGQLPGVSLWIGADPSTVPVGGNSTVRYSVSNLPNGSSATIKRDGNVVKTVSNGTDSIPVDKITKDTTFTISTISAGDKSASTTISVQNQWSAPTVTLTANKTTIASGDTVTLTINAANADRVYLKKNGSQIVKYDPVDPTKSFTAYYEDKPTGAPGTTFAYVAQAGGPGGTGSATSQTVTVTIAGGNETPPTSYNSSGSKAALSFGLGSLISRLLGVEPARAETGDTLVPLATPIDVCVSFNGNMIPHLGHFDKVPPDGYTNRRVNYYVFTTDSFPKAIGKTQIDMYGPGPITINRYGVRDGKNWKKLGSGTGTDNNPFSFHVKLNSIVRTANGKYYLLIGFDGWANKGMPWSSPSDMNGGKPTGRNVDYIVVMVTVEANGNAVKVVSVEDTDATQTTLPYSTVKAEEMSRWEHFMCPGEIWKNTGDCYSWNDIQYDVKISGGPVGPKGVTSIGANISKMAVWSAPGSLLPSR